MSHHPNPLTVTMDRSVSKSLSAPTVVAHPELTQYMRDNSLRMTKEEWACQTELQTQGKAVMAGSVDEAQFLKWLCGCLGAKKVIEVGVFRGSTTLTLALGLPKDGKVVGLDITDKYANECGLKYWKQAGVDHKIELRVGPATETMTAMAESDEAGTFDLVFIDANKGDYDIYYEQALKLLRVGGVIAIDNTFFGGSVIDPTHPLANDGAHVHKLNQKVHRDSRVDLTMLCIADGVSLCRKL